jgi:hypothetical protein
VVKKTTSLKIEEEVWKKVKIHCIKVGIDISDYMENLIIHSLGGKDGKKAD